MHKYKQKTNTDQLQGHFCLSFILNLTSFLFNGSYLFDRFFFLVISCFLPICSGIFMYQKNYDSDDSEQNNMYATPHNERIQNFLLLVSINFSTTQLQSYWIYFYQTLKKFFFHFNNYFTRNNLH